MRSRLGIWRVVIALAGLSLAGCGDDDVATDMGQDMVADSQEDATGDGEVDMEEVPIDYLEPDENFDAEYVSSGQLVTTAVETLQPMFGWSDYLDEFARSRIEDPAEFGRLHPQPGEPHQVREQVFEAGWDAAALPEGLVSVHFGFMIADPQLMDQESPTLLPKNNDADLPAYRPWGELVPHLTDMLIRAATSVEQLQSVIVVGDVIENAQTNELGWFQTMMSGGELSVDSGERDDVTPGPGNDPYDPFRTHGVPSDLPWLNVVGNHDVLSNGNFPPGMIREVNEREDLYDALSGILDLVKLTLPSVGESGLHRNYVPPADKLSFTLTDFSAFELSQLPYLRRSFTRYPEAEITPVPERHAGTICDFMQAHVAAPGLPAGHGFDAAMVERCEEIVEADPSSPAGGWYTYDLDPARHIRVIALALGPVEGGAEGILARPPEGCINPDTGGDCYGDPATDQVAFLEAELARAAADDMGVIILSHQSSEDIVTEPALASYRSAIASNADLLDIWDRWIPTPREPVDSMSFRQMLVESGVVLAHFAGHNHRNQIRAVCGDATWLEDATTPCSVGGGYWEVTTSGVVDFPHQARFFEIVTIPGSEFGAIMLTTQDARSTEDSLIERGRFISRAWEVVRGDGTGGLGVAEDRNVILPFEVPGFLQSEWTAVSGEVVTTSVLTAPYGDLPELDFVE